MDCLITIPETKSHLFRPPFFRGEAALCGVESQKQLQSNGTVELEFLIEAKN